MLTREQFEATYGPVSDPVFILFTHMREQVVVLTEQVKELQDRLSEHSHNSNKPPSSDGLQKIR